MKPALLHTCVVLATLAFLALAGVARAQVDTIGLCEGQSVTLRAPADYQRYEWRAVGGRFNIGRADSLPVSPEVTTTYISTSVPQLGYNRVLNSSLDSGYVNFESDYTFVENGGETPGTFGIVARPSEFRSELRNCRDVDRDGLQLMMVINADDDLDKAIWRQRVKLEPRKNYVIACFAWPQTNAPIALRYRINGNLVGNTLELAGDCSLGQLTLDYRNQDATDVLIEVLLINTPPGTVLGYDAAVVSERFPTRFDTTVVQLTSAPTSDTLTVSACEGQSITLPNGLAVTRDTVICRTLVSRGGCDSTVCEAAAIFDANAIRIEARSPTCAGSATGSLSLKPKGTGPFNYTWSDDPAATGGLRETLAAGNYDYTITNASGCSISGTVTLTASPPLRITKADLLGQTCQPAYTPKLELAAAGGTGDYSFSFRQNSTLIPREALQPGDFTVVATDAEGCVDSTSLALPTPQSLEIVGKARLLSGDTTQLSALLNGQPIEVQWAHGADCDTANILPSTSVGIVPIYQVALPGPACVEATTVLDDGCALRATAFIEVITPDAPSYYPTAFSPNGDGLNDVFAPVPSPQLAEVIELLIFDRWGTLVYRATDGRGQWDGQLSTSHDRLNTTGVYLYTASLLLTGGDRTQTSGEVTLLR